jgi:5-methyltetrahydropteroyltriglutamate--homocysteine methyltransferase
VEAIQYKTGGISMHMKSSNLGYPRIGENREWKKTLESLWAGEMSEEQFNSEMEQIRLSHLRKQQEKGMDLIPVGDFSYYDHVLDTAAMFGLLPKRFQTGEKPLPLRRYFEAARGSKGKVATEMTKWFNTNYHYIVPELEDVTPELVENRPLTLYKEAKEKLGINGKPVILGPLTFLELSKGSAASKRSQWVQALVPLYIEVLNQLAEAGAEWVQVDEPILVKNVDSELLQEFQDVYIAIRQAVPAIKIILQTYYESVDQYESVVQLPVAAIGLDFVHDAGRNLQQLQSIGFPEDKVLAAGIIDGRNVWKADLEEKAELINTLACIVGSERLILQPSCSLLHVPVTVKNEQHLDPAVQQALSFADEKLDEVVLLTRFSNGAAAREELAKHDEAVHLLNDSPLRNVPAVKEALANLANYSTTRVEASARKARWRLPLLPTTTIGSFPQTKEVRQQRLKWRKGEQTTEQYEQFIRDEIKKWIGIQEEIGLDVLVHGEFERTDMVEFFGEKLDGIAITTSGWVQSYGSRCVRPPVIFGDVFLTEAMTVKETIYAQGLTTKPVKGMLTGPVTILNWSFVRSDIDRVDVLNQLGLAIRQEVEALETNGIAMIQVDEPALREGLPLKEEKIKDYLKAAVHAFKLSTSSVKEETQIHTHMCYSSFEDIIDAIDDLDADVISIETSRSHGELISSFENYQYEKGIGLGVYDIHSPRVPTLEELTDNIDRALQALDYRLFWVNPDCGLKTRGTEETIAALRIMVQAAKLYREKLKAEQQLNV